MRTSQDRLLAHFRHYVLIALSGHCDDEEVLRAQVYAVPNLPQALVAEFDLRDAPTQILGFLPAPYSQEARACQVLTEALQGIDALEPLQDLSTCETVLDGLLRALDGELSGFLHCTQPATDSVASVVDQAEGRDLFVHLTQEILGGSVLPRASSRSADAYEVFAYSADELSTVIVRTFDHGQSFAFAACSSHEGCESPRFTQAVQQLLESRLHTAGGSPAGAGEASSLVRPLSPEEADTRLAAVLEWDHLQGAAYTQGFLVGSPSARTAQTFRALKQQMPPIATTPLAVDGQSNLFACALQSLRDLKGEPLWSEAMEEAHQTRIEILTHRAFPQALLAIAHLPVDAHLRGGWAVFVPDADPLVVAQIRADLTRMVRERGLFDTLSLPLSAKGPFITVPSDAVAWRLERAVGALAQKEGALIEQMAEREVSAALPTEAWALMQAVEPGLRLH